VSPLAQGPAAHWLVRGRHNPLARVGEGSRQLSNAVGRWKLSSGHELHPPNQCPTVQGGDAAMAMELRLTSMDEWCLYSTRRSILPQNFFTSSAMPFATRRMRTSSSRSCQGQRGRWGSKWVRK
jgi:hypothetical protein